jgi:hypothetical protein
LFSLRHDLLSKTGLHPVSPFADANITSAIGTTDPLNRLQPAQLHNVTPRQAAGAA